MAKVFVADDEKVIREFIRSALALEGTHHVAVTASTFQEAIAMIPMAKEQGCSVAIVDGSISSDNDGEDIAGVLRQMIENIRIVSLSGTLRRWGHVNLQKPIHVADLINAIG